MVPAALFVADLSVALTALGGGIAARRERAVTGPGMAMLSRTAGRALP